MAAELGELLEEQAAEPVHFIGHALGGLIGLELARRSPELVASLLFINAWSEPNAHSRRDRKSVV